MALGPEQRAHLRKQVKQQYEHQHDAGLRVGLELALRGLELSRKRLDLGLLPWDDYVRLKGHYNASAHGILDVLQDRGWSPDVVQLWKKYHGPLWLDLEEPPPLTRYVQEVFAKIIPKLVAPHMALKALNSTLSKWTVSQADEKSMRLAQNNIETITNEMERAGHALQVQALKAIHGYDNKPDFSWMSRFANVMLTTPKPLASDQMLPNAPAVLVEKKPRGLKKCTPEDTSFEIPLAGESEQQPNAIPPAAAWEDELLLGQPWEQALDIPAGSITRNPALKDSQDSLTKEVQKCSAEDMDLDIDSFGM